MSAPNETTLTEKDHDDAFTEVSFLLQVLASTVDDILGNPAPLGVSAGRAMAAKLPVHLASPTLEQALEALSASLAGGVDFTATTHGNTADLSVGHCILRDLSARQGDPPGARLCKMYHHYLSGMLSHLLGRQARVTDREVGDTCTLGIQTR
jgi:hypothetical protein